MSRLLIRLSTVALAIVTGIVALCLGVHYINLDSNLVLLVTLGQSHSPPFWATGESMHEPREEIGGALLNGKIYVVGGSDENGITDSVDYADPRPMSGLLRPPLPGPRDHIGVATFNGKLYAVGGFDHADIPTDQLLIYDPKIDEWQEGKSMPTARGALATEFINGTLYAVGGVDSTHNVVSTNEAYDPETDTWTERSPMPTARHHLASSVVDGKLYAIGGKL